MPGAASMIETRPRDAREDGSPGVASLLQQIEALPQDAVGTFVFGPRSDPTGRVLVERRRICWAVWRDQRGRLIDVLRRHSLRPLDPGTLESIYAHCRQSGEPFGQTLVNGGFVSAGELRRALEEHSAEALSGLVSDAGEKPEWFSREGHRHDAQFTFSTTEVLSLVGELHWGPVATQALEQLNRALDNGGWGVAVVRGTGDEVPIIIAEHGSEEFGVGGVITLGAIAIQMLAGDLGGGRERFITMIRDDRTALTAWERGGIVYGMVFEDAQSLACAIAQLGREGSGEDPN